LSKERRYYLGDKKKKYKVEIIQLKQKMSDLEWEMPYPTRLKITKIQLHQNASTDDDDDPIKTLVIQERIYSNK
jgi:hypothetical protein